ncbi:hypothetical protein HPULCUR_007709 [Helicostylum pulchrum]|uniref:BED-type domain-containing protein n=1 Tax=Helicostylum pulchrum TaxID=562976 RepID=A0ABP9Y5I5_9FUNG
MPRPLSDSWQYFELLSPDNGRNRKAKCNFCGHKQAAGITRLHQHLLYRCSRISADIRDQLRQKHEDQGRESLPKGTQVLSHHMSQDSLDYQYDSTLQNTLHNSNNNNSNNNNQQQQPQPQQQQQQQQHQHQQQQQQQQSPHINSHPTYYEAAAALSPTTSTNFSTAFPPTNNTLGQQQQAMLDCQLARALFSANIPFESIEDPHFIDFLKRLQPNYTVPKKRRLQQFLLKEQHWDLIPWDNEADLLLSRTNHQPSPPPLMQQQQQQRRMLSTNSSALSNRLLSSIHPPADLEGSL